MEINETTQSITFLCQIFGIAPYKIIRNGLNQIVDLKLSYAMCIYSIALITAFSALFIASVFYDVHFRHSVRLFSIVPLLNNVCAPIVSNIITSMFLVENTRQVNILLRKVSNSRIHKANNCEMPPAHFRLTKISPRLISTILCIPNVQHAK